MLGNDNRDEFRKQIIQKINLTDCSADELQIFTTRVLDSSKKVRLSLYERLDKENFDLQRFKETDRLSLVKNGCQDIDPEVQHACQSYLARQICCEDSPQNILKKLNLAVSWDNLKTSETIKGLYSNVVISHFG
jgi:hypothetical protein